MLRFSYYFCLDFGNRYLSLNLSCSAVVYSSSVKLECRLQMKNSFSVKFICKLLFIFKKEQWILLFVQTVTFGLFKKCHAWIIYMKLNPTMENKTWDLSQIYVFFPLCSPYLLNEICSTPEKVLSYVTSSWFSHNFCFVRQWFYREEEKGGWGSGCTWWLVRYCPEIGMYIQFNSWPSTLVCTYTSIVGQVNWYVHTIQ